MRKNKIIKVKRCSEKDIKECDHSLSNRTWGNEKVCEVIRPIDCPKLLCEGAPCIAGTLVNTNDEEVEFPCSSCNKPTKEEMESNKIRMLKDMTSK